MTSPVFISIPSDQGVGRRLAAAIGAEWGIFELRRFPDTEVYLRYDTALNGRQVILFCALDRPDEKILPLLFAAAAARDLGARDVGLVCPYLPYMRQDKRFRSGEAMTSTYFAEMLSSHFDWLVTVDPHLHRRSSLSEVYRIPALALHAAPLLADWVKREVPLPLLIGPDSESEQWIKEVAQRAEIPSLVLEKVRRGDRDVEISLPEIERWRDRTPVLIDDVISTGQTMIETVKQLNQAGMVPPVCLAVHGIFAGTAYQDLLGAGAGRIVTTNSVVHGTNFIDLCDLLAQGASGFLRHSA